MERRQFLATTALGTVGVGAATRGMAAAPAAAAPERKFYSNLALGLLGPFHATFPETITLATRYGFGGVDPNPRYFATLDDAALAELTGRMREERLGFGTVNLPVEFR